MHVTASWGGESVAVEVDAECRSVEGLKRCLQEALPEVDVEAVRLEVCGRPVDDEAVLGLVSGSVVNVSASQAALAAAALREEDRDVDFDGYCSAAFAGDLRLCKLYLEAGVVWPPGVTTPLHIAVDRGNVALCELFLSSGCDKDAQGGYGHIAPLHCASSQGNLPLTKLLLESGCAKEVKNNSGYTALHFATTKAHVEVTKLLLDSGCDANAKTDCGKTSLHTTVDTIRFADDDNAQEAPGGQVIQLTKLLLDAGCDKQVRDYAGHTPLDIALLSDRRKRLQYSEQLVALLRESDCAEDETAEASRETATSG